MAGELIGLQLVLVYEFDRQFKLRGLVRGNKSSGLGGEGIAVIPQTSF